MANGDILAILSLLNGAAHHVQGHSYFSSRRSIFKPYIVCFSFFTGNVACYGLKNINIIVSRYERKLF